MRVGAFLIALNLGAGCFAAATTQPSAPPQVAVFAFENVGPTSQAWIARAIEENFIAELSRGQAVWPVRAVAKSADQKDELTTARNSGAAYILAGSYQIVDDELRATGQIIAANDGHVIGGLTATGSVRDLFSIEDTLTMQAKRLLEPPSAPVAAVQPIQPSGPLMQSVPVVTNEFSAAAYQPATIGYQPQYNQYYYYSTPYTDYGYAPIYGFGGVVYSGGGFHHGFHGGGAFHTHIGWGGAGVVAHGGW